MINKTIIMGRLISDVEIKEEENGQSLATITIACPRPYKNENGEFDTDFIKCTIKNTLAQNVNEYCKKGDLIGITGRLQSKFGILELVAEKVTFLNSKKSD